MSKTFKVWIDVEQHDDRKDGEDEYTMLHDELDFTGVEFQRKAQAIKHAEMVSSLSISLAGEHDFTHGPLTPAVLALLDQLREYGCAVAVVDSDEINRLKLDRKQVERAMVMASEIELMQGDKR